MKDIKNILIENGFKQYMHVSGFIGWFKNNPMEYSDEWRNA